MRIFDFRFPIADFRTLVAVARHIALCSFVFLLFPAAAGAQEEDAPGAGTTISAPAAASAESVSTEGGWSGFLEQEITRIGAMDLYGVTSQLPQGYMSVKWDWGTIKAKNRYNDKRRLGPVMEPIAFTEPSGNEVVNIDLGLKGEGGGHTFQVSYGITDPLDWYIEVPFTYMNVSFNPRVADIRDKDGNVVKDAQGRPLKVMPKYANALGATDPATFNECDFLHRTLPALGRPTVATGYKGDWMMGDINTGFSWNIYRTPRFSVALTPRVFLPTAKLPSPNNDILYGTGPALETGVGGWAAGFTQGYDVRLFKWSYWIDIIASTEFTTSYAFPQQREYPTNFVVPSSAAQALDPMSFPDLSDLEGTFTYTPGWSIDWTVQLQVQLAILGLAAGYGRTYMQEPELLGDPDFVRMARGLELLGQQAMEGIQLGASISLLPLYIPLDLGLQWRKVVDGYNTIVMDDFFQITLKGYLPLKAMWN